MGLIQDIRDFKAFCRFRKTVKKEFLKRDSKMNQYNIKSNTLGNILYVQLNCDKSDYINASYNEEDMLMTKMRPITYYLDDELDFGDYLIPQVSNFVDEENNPTFSYGIVFVFTGYSLTITKTIIYAVILAILAIVSICVGCHFLF